MRMMDIPTQWGLGFQDWSTRTMYEIEKFHDKILIVMVWIVIMEVIVMSAIIGRKKDGMIMRKWTEGLTIEVVWTIIPGIVLVWIGIDSFKLLYGLDEIIEVGITVKAIGHQWYWSYEYGDYKKEINFDSYMKEEWEEGEERLLEVDNRMVIPVDTKVRVMVTAADVIHSWTVPSMGIKVDGIPGRINQGAIEAKRTGLFYGQCSELCGYGHGFMPIGVEVKTIEGYVDWVKSA